MDYVLVGLEFLLELLASTNLKHQRDGSVALCKLANKASSLSPVDAAPPSPTPQVCSQFNANTLSKFLLLSSNMSNTSLLAVYGFLNLIFHCYIWCFSH